MSTTPASSGPQPILDNTPCQSPAQLKQNHFDLAIALSIGLWEALNTAVVNSWGGPDSAGKRDWFAGAISELFISRPDTDEVDLECVLLQVMEDEFDVRVEDETEVEVAAQICRIRRSCERGDFSEIQQLQQRWTNTQGKRQQQVVVEERNQEVGSDEEELDDSDNEEAGGVDVDQEITDGAEAPRLVSVIERLEPEMDEDGFQKVVSKKKR